MATEVETLQVGLEARVRDFERDIQRMAASTEAHTRRLDNAFVRSQRQIDRFMKDGQARLNQGLSIPNLKGGLAGLAGALSTKVIADYADAWTEAGNKIAASGIGEEKAKIARDEVADIAARARTDFSATADLYARLTRAGQAYNASQAEVATATEVVAKSLKVTGASAQETESTLIQLGQALTSGRLQGDELRSLSENAPVVAKAIADAFGVTVGELKTLGAEGKLTSEKVFKAIVSAQPEVDRAFALTTGTIRDGFKALETAAIRYVGTSNSVSGASSIAAQALGTLAGHFDAAATGAMALGVVLGTRLVAAGLTPVVAGFGATVASSLAAGGGLSAFAAVAGRASLAATALGLASRTTAAAMSLLGGPVGAALFGLITVFTVLSSRQSAGAETSKIYAAALADVEAQANRVKPAIDGVSQAVDRKAQAMRNAATAAQQNGLSTFETDARNLETTIRGAVQGIEQFGAVRVSNGEKEQALAAIRAALEGDSTAAIDARIKLEELGSTNPSFSAAFAKFGQLLTSLAAVRQSAAATRAALAGIAAEGAADGERQRAASDQAALFKSGAPQIGPTAGPDPAFKTLELQREIALSKVDDTKRRVDAKAKELYEKDRALGQALSLSEYAKAAGQIIANEDAQKGGGRKKGGGEDKNDAYDSALESVRKRLETQRLEAELIGKSAEEASKARIAHELLTAAKQAERDVTPALSAEIEKEAAAYAAAEAAATRHKEALESIRQLQQFLGTSISGIFSDIASGGKNASDAVMNLTKKLADAALQAALLGQGPLASLFGTASSEKGGVGGLVGMLFSALSGGSGSGGGMIAGGLYAPALAVGTSNVPRDMLAQIHRGEMVVPRYDADLIRKGQVGGGISGQIELVVSASPEMDVRIGKVAQGVAVSVTRQGITANNARIPAMLEEQRMRS